MTTSAARIALRGLAALCLVLGAWMGPARADVVLDAQIGDEFERELDGDDVDRFRVPLIAGTRLRARLDADPDDDNDPGKSPSGPAPTVVILDPAGGEAGAAVGFDVDLRIDAATSGTYVVEVRAGGFVGEYDLDLDGELPDDVGDGDVSVSDGPTGVHLDVPVGTSIRIDVIRESGGTPRVVAVRDGLGRAVGFVVKRRRANRLRLFEIPVTAPGGLTVEVDSEEPGGGTYRVRARADEDDDELHEEDDDREERKVVVQIAAGTDLGALAAALEARFGWELEDVRDGFAVFETPEGREGLEDEDARAAAAEFSEILGAEPDGRSQIPEGSQSNGVALGSSLGRSDFESQSSLRTIAQHKVKGRASGQGVVVAVLDTGLDRTHPLFADRTLPGHDFVDDDAVPDEVENGLDEDLDGAIDEGFGHGTFVAGLVLAAAPEATILPVRVLDTEGRGTSSDIAAGIQYAIDQGADVINLSLGTRARSSVLRGAVRLALSHGLLVVASTGNGGNAARIDFPAGIAGVLSVSALDTDGTRAPFANAGRRTTISAPGVDLIGPYPGDRWGTWSGTSFATALVSGGAALLVERRPALRAAKLSRLISRRAKGLGRRVPRAERRTLGGVLHLGRLAR